MPRRTSATMNIVTATSGLSILAACLLTIDARVRDQVAQIITGRGQGTQLASTAWEIQTRGAAVLDVLRDQSLAYAPLTIFGLAAIVLVLFMTRT